MGALRGGVVRGELAGRLFCLVCLVLRILAPFLVSFSMPWGREEFLPLLGPKCRSINSVDPYATSSGGGGGGLRRYLQGVRALRLAFLFPCREGFVPRVAPGIENSPTAQTHSGPDENHPLG